MNGNLRRPALAAFAAFALLLALSAPAALAAGATYVFPYEGFRYTQAAGETVLTQTNLGDHRALIAQLGTTEDAILASYIGSGIVMEVLPEEGGQISVSVLDGGDFSGVRGIGDLSDARLAAFAAQFRDSGLYESCGWAQTKPLCVRLTSSAMYGSMPVYTLRYATLHLGRLYLLTKTIVGRAPEAQDDAAIAAVLGRMELLSAASDPTPAPTPTPTPTPAPTPAPTPGVALVVSSSGALTVDGVPAYTNSQTFTVTGSAEPGAQVKAAVGDRGAGRTTAGADGLFALDVTLPVSGDVTLTFTSGDSEQSFFVSYVLPPARLEITEPVDTTFTGTSVLVRGKTEPDATVYVNGKGVSTNVRANRQGAFSVRIVMEQAGTQTYSLRAKAHGCVDTTREITLTRRLTEREGVNAFRQQTVPVTYRELAADSAGYKDKKFSFRGKIAAYADYDGRPCALVLVSNVATGVWQDPVWVVLTGDEGVEMGDVATFYLEGEGTSMLADAEFTASGLAESAPVARAAYVVDNK